MIHTVKLLSPSELTELRRIIEARRVEAMPVRPTPGSAATWGLAATLGGESRGNPYMEDGRMRTGKLRGSVLRGTTHNCQGNHRRGINPEQLKARRLAGIL